MIFLRSERLGDFFLVLRGGVIFFPPERLGDFFHPPRLGDFFCPPRLGDFFCVPRGWVIFFLVPRGWVIFFVQRGWVIFFRLERLGDFSLSREVG